tara:strand:+ start:7267 stop:8916 length:1650 start_codon:yes stop_codon:yes gene_type:complete
MNLANSDNMSIKLLIVLISIFSVAVLTIATLGCSRTPSANNPAPKTFPVKNPMVEIARDIVMNSVQIVSNSETNIPIIDRLEISPRSVILNPGERIQMSAQAFSSDGFTLPDVELIWTSNDLRVGSITRDGVFQSSINPGTFDEVISVTAVQNTPAGVQYISDNKSVTVIGKSEVQKLSSIEIIPKNLVVLEEQLYQIRAVGLDKNGLLIPGVYMKWELQKDQLGRLNDIGLLTVEGKPGLYQNALSVTALWDEVELTVMKDIQVSKTPEEGDYLKVHALPQRFFLEPMENLKLNAVALNGLGKIAVGTELRWEMVNEIAGTIDGNGNFIAGKDPGVYTEAVRVEAVMPGEVGFVRAEDFASVVIRYRELTKLSRVSAIPPTIVLSPNQRAMLMAIHSGNDGRPADDVSINWEVLNKEVGEITNLGGFKAGPTPGIYVRAVKVTATQELENGQVTSTDSHVDVIITGTLAKAEIQPVQPSVETGKTIHFTIKGWDTNDILLNNLVVKWSVANQEAGTIDALGNFKAGETPGVYDNVIRAEIVQQVPDRN